MSNQPSVAQQPGVTNSMDHLSSRLDNLNDHIKSLEDKLAPILLDSTPQNTTQDGQPESPVAYINRLEYMSRVVDGLSARILELKDRVAA